MGRKGKKKQEVSRTYLKVQALFRCSKVECGKTWNSAHAWEREEEVKCEICFKKADIVNVIDEMLTLDIYECANPKCRSNPDKIWESIHDGRNSPQECWNCNSMVTPSGSQSRFGRHFWFGCLNKECAEEWEDISITPQRTQRCTKCKSRGDIIRLQRIPWRPGVKGEKGIDGPGGGGGGGAGSHNAEHCDMCQDLVHQGKGRSCLRFKKVQCVVTKNPLDGSTVETINKVE